MDSVTQIMPSDLEQGEHRCDICSTLLWFKCRSHSLDGDTVHLMRPPRNEWRRKLSQFQVLCFFVLPMMILTTIYVAFSLIFACHSTDAKRVGFIVTILFPVMLFCYFLILYKLVQYKCCSYIHFCGRSETLPHEYVDKDMSISDKNLYPWTVFADKIYNMSFSELE